MAGFPVVIVEEFGLPVVAVESGAPVATEVADLGVPIVLVEEHGIPLIVERLPEPEPDE